MTTVINTPPANSGDASGFGFVVGVLFVIVVIGLLVLFGLPYLKNMNKGATPTKNVNVNVQLPGSNSQPGN